MQNDGRVARAARSREAVAEAVLDLLQSGTPQPTAAQVAVRAGLSVRSVHNHFRDRDALLGAAIELQRRRVAPLLEAIASELPLAERIDTLARTRARLYETIGPVRRSALAAALVSERVGRALGAMRKVKRDQVAHVFARELGALDRPERADRLAAACAVSSWSAWEELRSYQGLSAARARRVLMRTLGGLFGVAP